jgi:small subunit ribosomal protein S14
MAKKSKVAQAKRYKRSSKVDSTKEYNRCRVCGRSRGYIRKFGMCRICFREYAHEGKIPGVKKLVW